MEIFSYFSKKSSYSFNPANPDSENRSSPYKTGQKHR